MRAPQWQCVLVQWKPSTVCSWRKRNRTEWERKRKKIEWPAKATLWWVVKASEHIPVDKRRNCHTLSKQSWFMTLLCTVYAYVCVCVWKLKQNPQNSLQNLLFLWSGPWFQLYIQLHIWLQSVTITDKWKVSGSCVGVFSYGLLFTSSSKTQTHTNNSATTF